MNRFIRKLSSPEVVGIAGFCAGFIWTIESLRNLLTNPLSSTFSGSIGGCIAAIGAGFVSGFMSPPCVPILVGSLVGSTIYYGYTNANTPKIKLQSNNNIQN